LIEIRDRLPVKLELESSSTEETLNTLIAGGSSASGPAISGPAASAFAAVAAIYFLICFPLSRLSRYLEGAMHAGRGH